MREFWFESEGTPLFAVEDGEGPVLVMLHGALANHQAALPLITPHSSRYRIIAPDLRGSGNSHSGEALSFESLASDVEVLLDELGVDRAFVGGVSSGSGIALRFALTRPGRIAGLALVKPVYAGEERGYTEQQKASFEMMDAVASRAVDEGVQVLSALYKDLPSPIREKALAMVEHFDAASVVATSYFVASGKQPFTSAADLKSLDLPVLLVRGDDPLHPSEVSDLYAANILDCTEVASSADATEAIGAFCDRHVRAA